MLAYVGKDDFMEYIYGAHFIWMSTSINAWICNLVRIKKGGKNEGIEKLPQYLKWNRFYRNERQVAVDEFLFWCKTKFIQVNMCGYSIDAGRF